VPALQIGEGEYGLGTSLVSSPPGTDAPLTAQQRRNEFVHDVGWRRQGETVDDRRGGLRILVRHTAEVPEASPSSMIRLARVITS
jgi:hypothetical protein